MIRKGSKVQWKWGGGYGEGKVEAVYSHEITKNLGGASVTRKGEKGNKALLIAQANGAKVLKLEQEVERQ